MWASISFDWSNLFFDQSKLRLKFLWSLCLFRSIVTVVSINRILRIRFIKNSDLTCWNHFFKNFSKLFLFVPLGKAPQQIFCRFPPNFLQGFSLHKPVWPYYPFFCIVFHVFMHYFMFFWVNFRTMYKFRFLMYQALFFEIDQWVLLLYWYIPNLWWLLWSIWGFVIN